MDGRWVAPSLQIGLLGSTCMLEERVGTNKTQDHIWYLDVSDVNGNSFTQAVSVIRQSSREFFSPKISSQNSFKQDWLIHQDSERSTVSACSWDGSLGLWKKHLLRAWTAVKHEDALCRKPSRQHKSWSQNEGQKLVFQLAHVIHFCRFSLRPRETLEVCQFIPWYGIVCCMVVGTSNSRDMCVWHTKCTGVARLDCFFY